MVFFMPSAPDGTEENGATREVRPLLPPCRAPLSSSFPSALQALNGSLRAGQAKVHSLRRENTDGRLQVLLVNPHLAAIEAPAPAADDVLCDLGPLRDLRVERDRRCGTGGGASSLAPEPARQSLGRVGEGYETRPRITAHFPDAYCVDRVYGRLNTVRRVLANVMAERIERGFMTRAEAVATAREILFETPRRIFLPEETIEA